MKKILILLSFFYSFLSSEVYELRSGTCYELGSTGRVMYASWSTANGCQSEANQNSETGIFIYGSCTTPSPDLGYGSALPYLRKENVVSVPCPPPPSTSTVVSNLLLQNGTNLVTYSDDATMMILSDGTASTWDIDGNEIPNRAYNGTTPTGLVFENDAFSANTNKKYIDISLNGYPLFLIQKSGDNKIGFHGGNITPFATLIPTIASVLVHPQIMTKYGDAISFTPTPTTEHPNAQTLNVTTMKFDNVDFSEYENTATSTPTPVPNTNLVVEKIDSTNQSKVPGIKSGTIIAHNNIDFSQFFSSTPTTVGIGSQAPNGTVTQTTFQKADIVNAVTNGTDLPFVSETITPPTIQSDGTTTQTTTTISQGSTNPTTGSTTITNPTTGTTTTVQNPITGTSTTAGTTSPSGTGTIDLSGVTSRLDKISNQITKINDFNDGLNKLSPDTIQHGISTTPPEFDNWESTWNNLKSDFDNVLSTVDELRNLVNGQPLTLNLSKSSINECPYSANLNLDGRTIPVSFDLCKSFSPMRGVIYIVSYLFLVSTILVFSFKILILLAV